MSFLFLVVWLIFGLSAIILTLILTLFIIFAADSLLVGHDLATSRKAIKLICKIIADYGKERGNFYDLGCGRGTLALVIKKNLPQIKVLAVDKNPIRIFLAKLKMFFLWRKINFKQKNILEMDARDLQNADVVYTYLWYDLMPILERKLKDSLRDGAIVITNTSSFPNWRPASTHIVHLSNPEFEKLFVYIKK